MAHHDNQFNNEMRFYIIICVVITYLSLVSTNQSKLPEVFDPNFDFTTADWKTAKINETLIKYVRTVEGYAVCDGDILLPIKHDEDAIFTNGKVWENGIVPYIFDDNLGQELKNVATNAMNIIAQKVPSIHFVEKTSQIDYVQIMKSIGYSSFVGRKGGKQLLNLAWPWSTALGSAQHEFLHCLGLWHEQSREDRDTWVIVNATNPIYQKRAPMNGTDFGDYDLGSIMHYPVNSQMNLTTFGDNYAKTHNITVGQRDGLSDGDVAVLRAKYGS